VADWSKLKVETARDRRIKRRERIKQEKKQKEALQKKRQIKIMVLSLGIVIILTSVIVILLGIFSTNKRKEISSIRQSCKITELSGKGEINKVKVGFFDNIEPDSVLQSGDSLRAKKDSVIKADFDNMSYFKLFSGGEIKLEDLSLIDSSDPENSGINIEMTLEKGALVVALPNIKGSFMLNTKFGILTPANNERCEFRVEDSKPIKESGSIKPLSIVVKAGKIIVKNEIGTKKIIVSAFQRSYFWEKEGQLFFTKPATFNPGMLKF